MLGTSYFLVFWRTEWDSAMVLVSMSTFMIFAIVFNGQKARILMKLDYNFNHGYQSKFFFLFLWWVLSIRKYWDSINLLLVGFGQQICSSPSPKCQDCLLNKLCPSASRSAKRTRIDKKRKDTKESESSEDIEDLVLESDNEDSEELDNFSKHIDKLKRSKWSRLRTNICIANKMLFENEFSHFYILFI